MAAFAARVEGHRGGQPDHRVSNHDGTKMNSFATLMLLAWVPISLTLFALLPARRAALATLLLGWMFLPIMKIPIPGIPDYDKGAAISYALFFGVLIFDSNRLLRFRLHWSDLAVITWIAAAPLSSIANNLGAYDAVSQIWQGFFAWGVPYLIGRLYLNSPAGLRDFFWAMLLAGIIYVPFVLYEVRMSPQLHRLVYGEAQHNFIQTMRGGGWRPMVFMNHGLQLSLFMAAASIAGLCLWRFSGVRKIAGLSTGVFVAAIAATLLLCKSTGAILICLIAGTIIWPAAGIWPRRLVMTVVPLFLITRVVFNGTIEPLILSAAGFFGEDRARSLSYRFESEQTLIDNFWAHPILGGGGWNFLQSTDSWTGEVSTVVPDSLWVIAMATTGALGLVSLQMATWWPAARAMVSRRSSPEITGAGMILGMIVLDSLVNAMTPAIIISLAGGLACIRRPQQRELSPRDHAGTVGQTAPRWLEPRPAPTATD